MFLKWVHVAPTRRLTCFSCFSPNHYWWRPSSESLSWGPQNSNFTKIHIYIYIYTCHGLLWFIKQLTTGEGTTLHHFLRPSKPGQVAPFAPGDLPPWRKRPGPRAAQRDVGVQGGGDGGEAIEDGGDQGGDQDLEGSCLVVHPTNRGCGLVHPSDLRGRLAPTKIPFRKPGL